MGELLSVIVPVYNVENYLEQCIDSILAQTYTNLEIILVDDGSTDSSGIICDKYAQTDSRIKIIHKKNEGLIAARRDGVAIASGNYVTFVDSDDWIKNTMYEIMLDNMQSYNVDIVITGVIRFFDEEDQIIQHDMIEEGYYSKTRVANEIIPHLLWSEQRRIIDVAVWSKLFKKNKLQKVMEKYGNETFCFGEDAALFYTYMLEVDTLYCNHEAFYYHRQRKRGVIAPYFKDEDCIDKTYALYKYLKEVIKKSTYHTVLLKQLDIFFRNYIDICCQKYSIPMEGIQFLFPYEKIEKGKKIVLYGAGKIGKQFYQQIQKNNYCKIEAWVDKNAMNMGTEIQSSDVIRTINYDYVVVAVSSSSIIQSIKSLLLQMGVKEEKIILPEGSYRV